MSNVNDGLIPYEGDFPVGVTSSRQPTPFTELPKPRLYGDPLSGPSHKFLVNKFGNTSISKVKSPIFGVWPNTG